MVLAGIEEAAANAGRMLKRFRESRFPVIHVQHVSARPGATFFLPETSGAAIHDMVAPLSDEVVVVKNYPEQFSENFSSRSFAKGRVQKSCHLRRNDSHVYRRDRTGGL